MVIKNFLLGILVAVLVLGMTVVGCGSRKSSNNSNVLNSKSVQLYNPVGTEYTGNGTVQVVNGSLSNKPVGYTRESSTLGKIAEISPDGKLTLQLPDLIPDNFIFGNDESFKYGFLMTSPNIYPTNDNMSFYLVYCDRDFQDEEFVLRKGWNYVDQEDEEKLITNLTGIKWIYNSNGR